jgi:hypothetical protein
LGEDVVDVGEFVAVASCEDIEKLEEMEGESSYIT